MFPNSAKCNQNAKYCKAKLNCTNKFYKSNVKFTEKSQLRNNQNTIENDIIFVKIASAHFENREVVSVFRFLINKKLKC